MVDLIVLLFVGLFINSLLRGWALSLLWNWFVAPLLSVPTLSFWWGVGLMFVATLLTSYSTGKKVDDMISADQSSSAVAGIVNIATVFILVFLGWLVNSWL